MNEQTPGIEHSAAPQMAAQPAVAEPEPLSSSPDLDANGTVVVASAPEIEVEGPRGIQFFLSVLVIVVFMITFVIQAFRVPSESMQNTLLIGDFLLADKLHYANDGGIWHWLLPYRAIHRGDIVVFRYPVDPTQYFVKRVIGLPGDRIRLQNKLVYVNGVRLQEDYAIHSMPNFDPYRDSFPYRAATPPDVDRHWRNEMSRHIQEGELIVPANKYFVMGDNRDQSLDSRYWGFVPRGNVMGRPLVIYLSLNDDDPPLQAGKSESDGKLLHSGQMLAHFLQMARWDRIFHRVL